MKKGEKHLGREFGIVNIILFILFPDRANIAKLLIANGANVNTKNDEKWSPLHVAAMFGKLFILFNQFIYKWKSF